ncbi:hypothetical protein [Geothrix sp. PMB-07]|uniref:hypothetical protein n=1 Tax=Geothrix sp. PMB-07 TaxID=3068640 RepID=UPI002740C0B9|nr:hypothetical protein [Geothrix sp. PMB-07]WLT32932.1 hypothetical protein Q9293_06285 [Geothrix sp. PMB-07]
MTEASPKAARLTLLTALVGLLLGGTGLFLGVGEGVLALWGFGAACLLQVAPALSLHGRIRDGLGNSGLERERLTLRWVSVLLRFLALGLAMAAVSALLGERSPQASLELQGLSVFAVLILTALWQAKTGLKGAHPSIDQEADRNLVLVELAALLLVGCVLARWFVWADAVCALAQALWLFWTGQGMAKLSALPPARGGCGGSCSCG